MYLIFKFKLNLPVTFRDTVPIRTEISLETFKRNMIEIIQNYNFEVA